MCQEGEGDWYTNREMESTIRMDAEMIGCGDEEYTKLTQKSFLFCPFLLTIHNTRHILSDGNQPLQLTPQGQIAH